MLYFFRRILSFLEAVVWKKPARITDLLANIFWKSTVGTGLTGYVIPVDDMPVTRALMMGLSDIVTLARRCPDEKTFAQQMEDYVCRWVEIAQQAPEAIHTWHVELERIEDKLAPHFGRGFALEADRILTFFVSGIITLLGSETKMLVGLQGNEFVWKKIRAIGLNDTERALKTAQSVHGLLLSVGPSDVWLVPSFRELDPEAKIVYENVTGYRQECEHLIGEAFLGRQYHIDPEGVYVKITGAKQGVTGLYLKVQARQDGHAYILVRMQTQDGAFYLVVDEGKLLKGGTAGNVFSMCSTYFDYLVCTIYHNLVTAADVPIACMNSAGQIVDAPSPQLENGGWSWIVAPRQAQGQVRSGMS
jgi:hypothetical protein